jgi:DNA replication protein DnaC
MGIAKQRREWRTQCGIPPLFQAKTFDTFEQKSQGQTFRLAKKYADGFPLGKSPRGYPSLILYSAHPCYGVGKTHLLSSVGHRILDRWQGETTSCPILFTTETDLLLRIRATYNISHAEAIWHEKEQDVYEKLETVDLLLFDDVGKEQPQDSRFTQRVYFNVIDGRYHRNLPIVLTSNLDLNQMADYIGMAATDRLIEMAEKNIIELRGDSYRRKSVRNL